MINSHEMSMSRDELINRIIEKSELRKKLIFSDCIYDESLEEEIELDQDDINNCGIEFIDDDAERDVKYTTALRTRNELVDFTGETLEWTGCNFTKRDIEYLENIGIKPIIVDINQDFPDNKKYINYDLITKDANILKSFKQCLKGKHKYQFGALLFIEHQAQTIKQLKTSLVNLTYVPDPCHYIIINDKKRRYIKVPTFKDKIVHHCINNVLRDYYEPKFIYSSFACIRGKGCKKAVLQIQQYLRSSLRKYEHPYFIKLDISKFFFSIDRLLLMNILSKDIKCAKTLYLIKSLLFTGTYYWEKGLPLGNLTSQLFANILMHQFDNYVKRVMSIEYYVRYADDMFIIVDGKNTADKIAKLSIDWIETNLRLTVNPKKIYIHNLRKVNKISGLGFNIYRDYITPLLVNKKKFIQYAKKRKLVSMQSWIGYASISKVYGFIYRVLEKYAPDIGFKNNKFYYKL